MTKYERALLPCPLHCGEALRVVGAHQGCGVFDESALALLERGVLVRVGHEIASPPKGSVLDSTTVPEPCRGARGIPVAPPAYERRAPRLHRGACAGRRITLAPRDCPGFASYARPTEGRAPSESLSTVGRRPTVSTVPQDRRLRWGASLPPPTLWLCIAQQRVGNGLDDSP